MKATLAQKLAMKNYMLKKKQRAASIAAADALWVAWYNGDRKSPEPGVRNNVTENVT